MSYRKRNGDKTYFVRKLRHYLLVVLPMLYACPVTSDLNIDSLSISKFAMSVYWCSTTNSTYYTQKPSTFYRIDWDTKQLYVGFMPYELPALFMVLARGTNVYFIISSGSLLHTAYWDGKASVYADVTSDIGFGVEKFGEEIMICGNSDKNYVLWVGSNYRNVYSAKKHQTTKKLTGIGNPQAIAFSKHCTMMYILLSDKSILMGYKLDVDKSTIADGSVVFDFKANGINTVTNGLAIDDAGHAWVGCRDTKQIAVIDLKNNTLSRTIDFPQSPIISLGFGGPGMDVLFASTDDGVFQLTGIDAIGVTIYDYYDG